jgi:glycyl-tRNA synthetase
MVELLRRKRDDMYGVDAAIIMNPRTWVASGHTATFSDPLVECGECHGRFRADKIADGITESVTTEEFKALNVKCPTCGKTNWGDIRQFNMMFSTHVGPVDDDSSIAYLRPETAQGIFTNYKNVVDSIYPDLPFGLAQQGKAFRNEISPRDFILRDRECSQMEIEYFVAPETWEENFEKLLEQNHKFLTEEMGLKSESIHDIEVGEKDRAHYSKRTVDIMFDYPNGQEELMGLAYRTDFDLANIQRESGKNMEYIVKGSTERFIPHVIEPSIGVERLILAVLSNAYRQEENRIVLALPEHLAPYRFCVSPLLKNKPELVAKAREVYDMLRKKYKNVTWDDSGNIGKRYLKQDEIGTPKCVVIDFDTLEDGTVTVRDRDTTEQIRIKPEEI